MHIQYVGTNMPAKTIDTLSDIRSQRSVGFPLDTGFGNSSWFNYALFFVLITDGSVALPISQWESQGYRQYEDFQPSIWPQPFITLSLFVANQ